MKDYSHIKEGMFVSLSGIPSGGILESQLLNAFIKAGAYPYEGRGEEYEYNLGCAYDYLGWGVGKGTHFSDNEDNNRFLMQVSVDFILDRGKTSSEALQDTLASVDTDVPDQGENVSESITDRFSLIGKIAYTKQYPDDGAIIERWYGDEGKYYVILPWQNKDDGILVSPEDISWVEDVPTNIVKDSIKITPNTSFTLTIRGQEFTLNEQELNELYNQLCYAEGKLHDFNLGD